MVELFKIESQECPVNKCLELTKQSYCNECGKCIFGYEGATQLYMILNDLTEKKSRPYDITLIQDLLEMMQKQSLCEDGVKLANKIQYALVNFKEDFEDHANKKSCKNGVCSKFMSYHILPEKCIGCGECIDACEEDAILGKNKFIHVIEQDECIQCGACLEACEEDAIVRAGAQKPRCPKVPIPCKRG